MKTYPNFTMAYVDLLKQVYLTPEHEAAPRGMKVKERLGHSFRISDVRDRLPYVPHRDFSISYCIAEILWYLSANNSTDWISNYASFWKNISDDGITANSSYGSRIFSQHEYQQHVNSPKNWTQWDYVKEELKKDPDSRRAVIHIRMPQDSYLAVKDVPCTLSLQFFIRDGELHQVASMRSSDLILGIAYDIPAFTMFQELLALELNVKCGSYTHMSNSLHIYEKHYGMVEKIINEPWVKSFPHRAKPMPAITNLPNLEVMNYHESKFRSICDEELLKKEIDSLDNVELDHFWKDFLYVLAWHRANKLGLIGAQDAALKKISFGGYKIFNK